MSQLSAADSLERKLRAVHSPGLVTDRIDPDDSSASRSEYSLSTGIFGELVTSPADLQLCWVGEVSAHGVAPAPAVRDASTFFAFGFATPVARWCFPARPSGQGPECARHRWRPRPVRWRRGCAARWRRRPLGAEPTSRCVGVDAGRAGGFWFVVGVDRVGQADAMRAHGADTVVSDLADLVDRP